MKKLIPLQHNPRSYAEMNQNLLDRRGDYVLTRQVDDFSTLLKRCEKGIALQPRSEDYFLITWHPDDTVTLNTDGWYTQKSMRYFNEWLPRRVVDGDRYMRVYKKLGYLHVFFNAGESVPLHDGMVLDLLTCTEFSISLNIEECIVQNEEIEKLIQEYASQLGLVSPPFPWSESQMPTCPDRADFLDILQGKRYSSAEFIISWVLRSIGKTLSYYSIHDWFNLTSETQRKNNVIQFLRSQTYVGPSSHSRMRSDESTISTYDRLEPPWDVLA